MQYDVICEPSYSAVEIQLETGEQIVSEAGALAWKTPSIRTDTSTRGGFLTGLKRAALGGESFFQNTYTAESGPGSLTLAPGCCGDIVPFDLDGELILEKSAYLASQTGVHCDSKYEGFKGFFNEGLFVLRVTGKGMLFFNSYGSIHEIDVDGSYTLDNGYAVAWEPALQYRLTKARKIRSFLFSDQILLQFSGQGKLWAQSRSPQSLSSWVYPFRRVKSKN